MEFFYVLFRKGLLDCQIKCVIYLGEYFTAQRFLNYSHWGEDEFSAIVKEVVVREVDSKKQAIA